MSPRNSEPGDVYLPPGGGEVVSWYFETEYMASFFFTWTCLSCLFTIADVNQGNWPSLPSGDFTDEGDAVPFLDALRHKYTINEL